MTPPGFNLRAGGLIVVVKLECSFEANDDALPSLPGLDPSKAIIFFMGTCNNKESNFHTFKNLSTHIWGGPKTKRASCLLISKKINHFYTFTVIFDFHQKALTQLWFHFFETEKLCFEFDLFRFSIFWLLIGWETGALCQIVKRWKFKQIREIIESKWKSQKQYTNLT